MKEIQKLTAQEIQSLDVAAAQRILAENVNFLAELDKELFDAVYELGQARIRVEQLKNTKSTIIEMNRALKSVLQIG